VRTASWPRSFSAARQSGATRKGPAQDYPGQGACTMCWHLFQPVLIGTRLPGSAPGTRRRRRGRTPSQLSRSPVTRLRRPRHHRRRHGRLADHPDRPRCRRGRGYRSRTRGPGTSRPPGGLRNHHLTLPRPVRRTAPPSATSQTRPARPFNHRRGPPRSASRPAASGHAAAAAWTSCSEIPPSLP
jgi:hypothetical protein